LTLGLSYLVSKILLSFLLILDFVYVLFIIGFVFFGCFTDNTTFYLEPFEF